MNEKCFALPIEKQQRILDAAYQAFFKCGYQGASLSEIASNAGISNVCPDVDLLQSRSRAVRLHQRRIPITPRTGREERNTAVWNKNE